MTAGFASKCVKKSLVCPVTHTSTCVALGASTGVTRLGRLAFDTAFPPEKKLVTSIVCGHGTGARGFDGLIHTGWVKQKEVV